MSLDSALPDSTPSLISPALPELPGIPTQTHLKLPLKLGILASGTGSNFEAIVNTIATQQLHAQIQVLVYNNPDAKVVAKARKRDIPAILLDHRCFASREELDAQIAKVLHQFQVDLVVMAGWMRRVTQVLIDAFPDRILNIHPSLLPSFPGIRAVEQALNAGVKISGCTVHVVRLEVDSGPIVMQAAVPVLPDDTPQTLAARIQVQEHRIFPQSIALYAIVKNSISE